MFTISPSIYSADAMNLEKAIKKASDFEHIHIDIDDGNFVRGISFGMDVVKGVCEITNVPVDVHLEVLNPLDYINDLCNTNVDMIVAHVEQLPFPSLFLSKVHNANKKAGLALNIKTPISFIEPYLEQLDLIILVSVEADDDGLLFREGVLEKAKQIKSKKPDAKLWMDGGINKNNLKKVIEAGTDGIVLGRAIFKADNPSEAYKEYLKIGREYERNIRNDI